jgi:hypothetical protein
MHEKMQANSLGPIETTRPSKSLQSTVVLRHPAGGYRIAIRVIRWRVVLRLFRRILRRTFAPVTAKSQQPRSDKQSASTQF